MHCFIESPEESRLVRAIRERRAADHAAFPPGLHYSSVIERMMKDMYPGKYKAEMNEAAAAGYQEIGNAYEDLVAANLRHRFGIHWTKPAPIQYRGFIMSPDGEHLRSRTIHETKATWVSCKAFLDLDDDGVPTYKSFKFMRYEYQIIGYLAARGWTRGRLHVWFINGDYPRGAPVPQWPWTIRLSYTPTEIRAGFHVVHQYAKDCHLL